MLGQVLKARVTPARVLGALRDPHYRTGYALVANTVGTTAVGFFYWVVAAHLYDRQALGRCSALVSALIVVSSLAQLDLPTILPRFLPQAGRSTGRFIAYGYGASSVAALAVGVGFVTILPRLSPQWQFLRTSPSLAVLFIAALVIWGDSPSRTPLSRPCTVRSSCRSRIRSTGWPAAPARGRGHDAAVNRRLRRLAGPAARHRPRRELAHLPPLREAHGCCQGLQAARARDHPIRPARLSRLAVLPGLRLRAAAPGAVRARSRRQQQLLRGLDDCLGTQPRSLQLRHFPAGRRDTGTRPAGRADPGCPDPVRAGRGTGAAVMTAGGRIILRLFGPAYGDASLLLVLLGTATIPISIVVVTLALDRIAGRTGRVALVHLALAVLVLGLSVPLMKKLGIEGVGFACLTAGLVVALVRFPTVVRAIRQPGAVIPVPRPGLEPVLTAATESNEHTIILSPLAWGAARYQVALGHVTRPAEDDMTVILSPLAWLAAPDHMTGNVLRHPDQDMTMLLSPLAWSPVRDQVMVGNLPKQPPGYLPRPALQARLNQPDPVIMVTGRPGTGKTQLVAAYARTRLEGGWRLVAWVDAQDVSSLRAGLAAVADAERLPNDGSAGDPPDAARLARRMLEADGHRCLLVLDNADDLDALRPVIPRRGAAQVMIITSRLPAVKLGISVPVDALSAAEALALLTERTGLADDDGAATVAAELGHLPLALTQATAVIAHRHLTYSRYLKRLRAMPAGTRPVPGEPEPYPPGVVRAAWLALEEAGAAGDSGVCARVMEIVAVLPQSGVRRELLHAAGEAGVLASRRHRPQVSAQLVDVALGRLAERSLLAVGVDGQTVIAHGLVRQVARDQLLRRGRLAAVSRAVASVLDMRAAGLAGSPNRSAIRDILGQLAALRENIAGSACEHDDELDRTLLSLQFWALYHLNELGDSTSQAIAVGKPLVADSQRVLGPDHPDTLTVAEQPRGRVPGGGPAAEAIPLLERTLAALERRLGSEHPDAVVTPEQPCGRVPGGGPGR